MIHVVLLSGGSGTRLWPLSNNARSKQFLKVLRDEYGNHVSMVQRVFAQIQKVPAEIDITIATSTAQEASLEMQVGGQYELVLEPERRDTAPAIMLACSHLSLVQKAAAGDTVVVMPIDTYANQEYYDRINSLDAMVQANVADLVLLGVKPTYPSEKYGYIIPANCDCDISKVSCFKEKPTADEAEVFISQGGLWNCGVFAFRLGYMEDIIRSCYAAVDYEDMLTHYACYPKNSFDYEVVEKADDVAVVSYSGCWKDLGTWNTLSEEMPDDRAGRVVLDDATCSNVHVINETGLPLVVAGLKDSIVVVTPDGVLAASKEACSATDTKRLVGEAAVTRPMYERRRWGEYRVLDFCKYANGKKSLVKELVIEAGKQLSYQRHHLRSEVWTVVSGQGEVALDGEVRAVSFGSSISIETGCMHSVRAFDDLRIIEVQLGEALDEEDIERFGNYW